MKLLGLSYFWSVIVWIAIWAIVEGFKIVTPAYVALIGYIGGLISLSAIVFHRG